MAKIEIATTVEVLKRHKLEPALLREIVQELNEIAQPEDEGEAVPRQKQQFAVVVSDPEGKLKSDYVGWVVQLPEDAAPHSVLDRVMKAAHDFNASKKGRLLPVTTVGEAFESVKRKFFKEAELTVKTKLPVYLLRTDNKLTETPSV